MPYMTRIPSDLRRWGLDVDVVSGWETRGRSSFAPAGVVDHWTGTTQRPGVDIPTLRVLRDGHGSLPGPLCQVGLARSGRCYVVAAGRANHAGTGGWKGLRGNSSVYGIEAEANGPNSWTTAQREAYPLLIAALLDGLDRGAEMTCGHSEWAGPRKQDIDGWPMSRMRADVARLLTAGPGGTADPTPVPPTETKDGFDMAEIKDLEQLLDKRFEALASRADVVNLTNDALTAHFKASGGLTRGQADQANATATNAAQGRAAAELGSRLTADLTRSVSALGVALTAGQATTREEVAAAAAALTGLRETVRDAVVAALGERDQADVDAVTDAVAAGLASRLTGQAPA